jgi:S-DNA-T family DNA segregation ATPase FtsK/SpoIIIE
MPKSAANRKKSIPRREPKSRRPQPSTRQTKKPVFKPPTLPRWEWGSISPERKLDILGIVMALVGLLSLLGLLSKASGVVSAWWVNLLYNLAGWGAFLLPIVLTSMGLWLVFRHIDRLPRLSAGRLVGAVLLFFNLLSWLHLVAGGGFEIIPTRRGGGYMGGIFESILVNGLGKAGAVVVLLAWFLVGLALAFDITIPELFQVFRAIFIRLKRAWTVQPQAQSSQTLSPHESGSQTLPPKSASQPPLGIVSEGGLPNGFRTLPDRPQVSTPARSQPTTNQVVGTSATTSSIATAANIPEWKLPLLDEILEPTTPQAAQANLDHERARIIETTLASFSVPVHVVEVHRGPAFTQFGVEPDFIETRSGRQRVRVAKIVALANDIAMALAASRIRIQAPVPGRNYVGIEVPNLETSPVTLREVLESEPFQRSHSALRFGLGMNVSGHAIPGDLANMPHLLIAGATGAGKSVCINAILCSLLMFNSPLDLRLVLIDPKRVELTHYNGIPHLLAPVVVEPDRVIGALQWMLREMDSRYTKFSQAGVRNITEYNAQQSEEHLPFIVMIIDELADLMLQSPLETERNITRLAQMARATGIHLVLATQRPSVNVVTGLIKANFPSRIAFMVAQMVDSRVILDQPGAEQLLGRGDMLFQAPDASAPVRLQGAFVSPTEISRLVDFWHMQAAMVTMPTRTPSGAPMDAIPNGVPLRQTPLFQDMEMGVESGDPLLNDAIDLVRREGRASITMLQRKLRVGYTRAARLVDSMEEKGIIAPPVANSQVREVLDYGQAGPPPEEPD